MHDSTSNPGSSDGKVQRSADSATMEEQRQAESSSQSLARLTMMCQVWRSFTHAPPALPLMDAQISHQMWPGQLDSRVVTQVGSSLSTLQQCIDGGTAEQQGSILSCMPCCAQLESAAADLESGSQEERKKHTSNTADEPVSAPYQAAPRVQPGLELHSKTGTQLLKNCLPAVDVVIHQMARSRVPLRLFSRGGAHNLRD